MPVYVDFRQLKDSITIDQVVQMLALDLKGHGQQLRGRCPIHRGSNDREFVVTPDKGLFYCFGGCGGGDLITLVAKVKDIATKEAAVAIAEHFGLGTRTGAGTSTVSRNSSVPTSTAPNGSPQPLSGSRSEPIERTLQPLTYLQPSHELVQGLGVAPETAEAFGAGYSPKGIMRGRLAIPIHDRDGRLLAYCGRALKGESPMLTFPNGFDLADVIFNAERVVAGELYLVRDPLQVLVAHESGIDNVVAFLTENIAAQQLEMLTSLMDERQCDTVELF